VNKEKLEEKIGEATGLEMAAQDSDIATSMLDFSGYHENLASVTLPVSK
jgi:hypothetical protein